MKRKQQSKLDKEGRSPAQQRELKAMLKSLGERSYHLPKRTVKNMRAARQISRSQVREMLA